MGNKCKYHFIIKKDYIFDESMSLNAHKMLLLYEKNKNILLNIKFINLIILNYDNINL